jgi:hypothetical protein
VGFDPIYHVFEIDFHLAKEKEVENFLKGLKEYTLITLYLGNLVVKYRDLLKKIGKENK